MYINCEICRLLFIFKMKVFVVLFVWALGAQIAESLRIISRSEWGARKPKGTIAPLSINPPPYAIVHHSATGGCSTEDGCKRLLRSIQSFHMDNRGWADIGYNFLIGGNGDVFEGRGFNKRGAHAPDYNGRSLGICMLGLFTDQLPTSEAMKALKELLAVSVSMNKLDEKYELLGHRQVTATLCPGDKLYREIQSWPHYPRKVKA